LAQKEQSLTRRIISFFLSKHTFQANNCDRYSKYRIKLKQQNNNQAIGTASYIKYPTILEISSDTNLEGEHQ